MATKTIAITIFHDSIKDQVSNESDAQKYGSKMEIMTAEPMTTAKVMPTIDQSKQEFVLDDERLTHPNRNYNQVRYHSGITGAHSQGSRLSIATLISNLEQGKIKLAYCPRPFRRHLESCQLAT